MKKLRNRRARGKPPQRENDERQTVEFEKLLRHVGAHAGAESCSGNDGSDSSH